MKRQEYRMLRMEYLTLLAVLVIRILLNGLFYFYYKYDAKPNCSDRRPSHIVVRAMFLGFGETLMHFVPVCLILYIYWPRKSE